MSHYQAGYRAQVRLHLAQGMASVSGMLAMLDGLDGRFSDESVAGLRSGLEECYGRLGNLLAEAAPWRDQAAVSVRDEVLIPDEENVDGGEATPGS